MNDMRMYCFLPFSALLNPLDTKTVEQMLQITNVWEPMFAVKILLRWTQSKQLLHFQFRDPKKKTATSLTSFCFQNQINPTLLHCPFYLKKSWEDLNYDYKNILAHTTTEYSLKVMANLCFWSKRQEGKM